MPDLSQYLNETGFLNLTPGNLLLIALGLLFIYTAIAKKAEPYELLPIGIGVIIANLPLNALTQLARVTRWLRRHCRDPVSLGSPFISRSPSGTYCLP